MVSVSLRVKVAAEHLWPHPAPITEDATVEVCYTFILLQCIVSMEQDNRWYCTPHEVWESRACNTLQFLIGSQLLRWVLHVLCTAPIL